MGKKPKREQKVKTSDILDEQTFAYYSRISETINGEFENEEKRVSFINAVLKAVSEEGLQVSRDKTVSTVVEEILGLANGTQLRAILNNFSKDWELACCDRCVSFVTQSLLRHLSKHLGDAGSDSEMEGLRSVEELIDELVSFLKVKVVFYMDHASASHVLRVVIEVLSGSQVSDMVIRGKNTHQSRNRKKIELQKPPAQYQSKLLEICDHIVSLPNLEVHVKSNLSNPVLQTILLCLKSFDAKKSARLSKKMMSNSKLFDTAAEKDSIPENFVHEVGSRLVEQFLLMMPADVYRTTWEKHFRGRVLSFANHPVANFVLQKLISRIETEAELAEMFEELSPEIEAILSLNHFGVVVALTEASVKHKALQPKLISMLQKAFHCDTPPERQCKIVSLLISLTTYEVFYQLDSLKKKEESGSDDEDSSSDEDEEKAEAEIKLPTVTNVNFHGSVMIQNLLRFSNTRPVVSSFFELKPTELKNVCCDPCGSHIIEVFLSSETVGEKSREMLYNKLKAFYIDLACEKSGSRTFDALWDRATVKQKTTIAEELVKHEDRLKGNRFGFFIHSKCALSLFKQRPEQWKEAQSGLAKKRKLTQDIVKDTGVQSSKKKAKLK